MNIQTVSVLHQIQILSNERQQLWRIAHRNKFSPDWWKRHHRIKTIGKQLAQLWHIRRMERAGEEWQIGIVERLADSTFDDYRARAGEDMSSAWRIEDEAAHERRYMSLGEGFQDNQTAHDARKSVSKRAVKPKIGARQRKNAAPGMIQLS